MRILLIGPIPPEFGGRSTGGIATHVQGLATHLTMRGHEVGILADNRDYDPASWPALESGISVFGIADFAGPARMRALASPRGASQIVIARCALSQGWSLRWLASKIAAYRSVIADFRPDIVHVHTLEARYALADAVLGGTIPLVATAHSSHYVELVDASSREANATLVGRNLGAARDVIYVSDFLRRRYAQLFPKPAAQVRTRVVHNPIDVAIHGPVPRAEARRAVGVSGEGPVLLFVGNLIDCKDVGSLLRAVALLAGTGTKATALIVGDGVEAGRLGALADDLGVADCVRFEGRRPQSELSAYYSAADIFVFPSVMEGFGLVAVEAMLCGTPVVGTPEVFGEVVPEFGGSVAPVSDPAALAEAISAALARTWDRDAIREYALGFDWERRIGEYEAVYAEVRAGR